MKKVLSLLLAFVFCFVFCACNGNLGQTSPKQAIIGEWKSVKYDASFTFLADGTGHLINKDNATQNFTWKYDKDLKSYLIAMSQTYNITMLNREGIAYFEYDKQVFYRSEDYDTGLGWYLNDMEVYAQQKVTERAKDYTKIELGTAYPLDEAYPDDDQESSPYSIIFTDVTFDGGNIYLYADITNVKQVPTSSTGGYMTQCYYYLYPHGDFLDDNSGNYVHFEESIGDNMCVFPYPGETKSAVATVECSHYIQEMVDKFGVAYGTIEMNLDGTVYYFDMSDYIKR